MNDVKAMAAKAKAAGALVYVDAVQLAPHYGIDVQSLGCDVLVTSAYKWFGPHQGILWGREAAARGDLRLQGAAGRRRPPGQKFETGTLSHEGMAGTLGAIEYLEELRRRAPRVRRGSPAPSTGLPPTSSSLSPAAHRRVSKQFRGLTIRGITSANAMHRRVPTVSFTLEGAPSRSDLPRRSPGKTSSCGRDTTTRSNRCSGWGSWTSGGVLRVGLAHYNTVEEIDTFLAALDRIVRQ